MAEDPLFSIRKGKGVKLRLYAAAELCLAVYEGGDYSYLRLLLKCGCSPDATDYDMRTAGHICCGDNLLAAALILLEHGADFASAAVRNASGRTPLEEGEANGHTLLVATLQTFIRSSKQ